MSEWETVDNVDSSAMVEAIVGDNLVDLRSDLRGFMGARVEVEVVSTTIDLDAQFEARIVEDGEDETSRSQEVTLSGREVEAARADGYSKVAAATVSSANLRKIWEKDVMVWVAVCPLRGRVRGRWFPMDGGGRMDGAF